ncbi:GID complex subunit 4, VID24 [Mortierella sp. GBA30]|nr:GID complex subunit 4, VID24 [Mortierella sp. GBA30]
MPVYRQITPTSSSSPSSVALGDISAQLACTCPFSQGAHSQDKGGGMVTPADNYTSLSSQNKTEFQQNQQHLSTCAFHASSMSVLKQQAKQRQLKIQQEQQRKRDPFDPPRVVPTKTFHLYAGSRFRGKQRSGTHSYDVMVDIKHVDLTDSFLCGYLRINGLTEEYPELTTYFEAEIIGPKHSFLTHKWDADELIDEEHWTLFKPFECLASSVFYGLDVHDGDDDDDHPPCPHRHHYDPQSKLTGQISGYYYHQSSEKFQQLLLTHEEERSLASFEFR